MKSSRKKRVLLDTSTLFSSLGWTGAPFEVLLKINEGDFKLVLTDYILDELSDHFKDFPPERKKHAIKSLKLLKEASVIEEKEWKKNLNRAGNLVGENKDAPIMAAFLTNKVDVLVTSNTKDFPTEDKEKVQTPDEFLKKI
ncbi:hypothetical protein AKJ56_01560 [candidate division MSBL1 archaeon SCGC-AAA382N08]|uniref:PIN domain-containing protein n=1 Tax=candidate division MSBL1 archaeon SCGC-AAA382N08 TaxID=1698285 RepID=A0A133VPD2_9EURY|nr:hypothetical protein AKJ56_01560 [candidate division MSBL1 archaeon SCGC-AAA382N08]